MQKVILFFLKAAVVVALAFPILVGRLAGFEWSVLAVGVLTLAALVGFAHLTGRKDSAAWKDREG